MKGFKHHTCSACHQDTLIDRSALTPGPNFPKCSYCGASMGVWFDPENETTSDLEIGTEVGEDETSEDHLRAVDSMVGEAAAINAHIRRGAEAPPPEPVAPPDPPQAELERVSAEVPPKRSYTNLIMLVFLLLLLGAILFFGLRELNII